MGQSAVASVVNGLTLLLICVMAFSIRLFSVIKYESVIHEFDPYFNYRVTQFLTKEGFYNLWNWFDVRTWYPLGRVVGGTVFPGLTFTAGMMYKLLHAINIPLNVQEVCVFTAPLFSAFCSLATYGLVNQIRGKGPGLVAAALISTVPSYISRSVAGSFDNEGVAIFALVFTFYLFVKTLNTGSLAWATGAAASYLYMVMSWGGYTFIINLLPIHCLVSIFTGRLSGRLYVAYAPLIVLGTLLAASIPVVGFNAVLMSEHFGGFLAFGVLHVAMGIQWVKGLLPERSYRMAKHLLLMVGTALVAVIGVIVVGYVTTSPTYGWTGRSLSLLDPTYASKYIPIIASVSEHQPPTWSSYFTDINVLVLILPAGFIACFSPLTDASLFLLLYGLTSVYFSGVMVRLMLVLAPAACCLGALAISSGLSVFSASVKSPDQGENESTEARRGGRRGGRSQESQDKKYKVPADGAFLGLLLVWILMVFYSIHSTWVSAEMYSAPSIVLQTRGRDGVVHVFDDFRESYSWLRHNTDNDCKVASWWDYGYQTTAMADRTVIVDNNTWNNTHIATVGRAMASPEKKAWKIFRSLDVDYVFVVFGGWVGYPSDDINKFLWMVRIGGGVFPEIKEKDYLSSAGQYKIDATAGQAMLDSLMYKLSYYNFAEGSKYASGQFGFDRVRNTVIGKTSIQLKYFEEVFTSEHWMVRIYKVKDPPNRDFKRKNPKRRRLIAKKG
ncbi:hypothetical protein BSKO_08838 [Bryopsis sp. KO-2023]|nr:hypothetical protein BSKO_08838 [Bryopsis sp. KO-2023]